MRIFSLTILISHLLIACTSQESAPEILSLSNGSVERIEAFPSDFVPPRNIDVWMPEDFSKEKKYAVLYMHDGQMLYDSTTTWNKQEWGVDEIMGQLLSANQIRPTIVVGIWNTEFRHSEYFPQKPFESLDQALRDSLYAHTELFKTPVSSDNYLKFITKELKPHIDQHYPTLSDPANTFVAGSSMGGLISLYALCEYPEIFRGAACLSTHWVGTFDTLNNPIPAAFASYLEAHLPPAQDHRIYFDFGTETLDALYEPSQAQIDSIMVRKGYNAALWRTQKFPGANHSERAWRKRLGIPLGFLLGENFPE
ncbi:MAG: alpha/beta hydrolase-fold protein [Bacteroidota bacterium]